MATVKPNRLDLDNVNNDENAAHLKLKLKKNFSNYFKLSFGSDYFITKFDEDFTPNIGTTKSRDTPLLY
jgi:hypothetical protein